MSVNHAAEFVKRRACSQDAFLGGKLSLAQPRDGFRAGIDSVLLAASLSAGARSFLDLGAGAGAASLCALVHDPARSATLVDNDPEALAFAAHNARTNGLDHRVRTIALDVTARGAERQAAGLETDHFDAVIANPPFFQAGAGTLSHRPGRAAARHMNQAEILKWVTTAISSAHADGEIIFIHAVTALPALLAAFSARLGGIGVLPIASRQGEPASRVLVRGRKTSRSPLRLLGALYVHGAEGRGFSPEADAILNGRAVLDWHKPR